MRVHIEPPMHPLPVEELLEMIRSRLLELRDPDETGSANPVAAQNIHHVENDQGDADESIALVEKDNNNGVDQTFSIEPRENSQTPVTQSEQKLESQPEARPERKLEQNPRQKPETEHQPERKPAQKPLLEQSPEAEYKPNIKPDDEPLQKPDDKQEQKLEPEQISRPEHKQNTKPDNEQKQSPDSSPKLKTRRRTTIESFTIEDLRKSQADFGSFRGNPACKPVPSENRTRESVSNYGGFPRYVEDEASEVKSRASLSRKEEGEEVHSDKAKINAMQRISDLFKQVFEGPFIGGDDKTDTYVQGVQAQHEGQDQTGDQSQREFQSVVERKVGKMWKIIIAEMVQVSVNLPSEIAVRDFVPEGNGDASKTSKAMGAPESTARDDTEDRDA